MKKKTIKELKEIKCITKLEEYIKKKENIKEFKKEVKKEQEIAKEKLKLSNDIFTGIAAMMECYANTVKACEEFKKANEKIECPNHNNL